MLIPRTHHCIEDNIMKRALALGSLLTLLVLAPAAGAEVSETAEQINISTSTLEAAVRKTGYVTGIYRQSFLDKKTGFRDAGFGLDIVDWLMEPGSDERYRQQLTDELRYEFDNPYHGKRPKRSIEGPQICTQARELSPRVIEGQDFVAVKQDFTYETAAPDKKAGSRWQQTIVLPAGKRYFISCDHVTTVNDSDGLFQRIDMPGHIRHQQGDTFSEIYLSYLPQATPRESFAENRIPSSEFTENFAPDERFNYRRDDAPQVPQRFIRAYRLRDPQTGKQGPWLAGMTLAPEVVYEAWCHQRGYVCMIQEYGGRPIKAGESFSAAFIVGFFDSIDEMHTVYDQYKGHTSLEVDENGWKLK
jgi:hypothetical protein